MINFENNFWIFESVLPPHICQSIINLGNSKKLQEATIGSHRELEKLYNKSNKTRQDFENIEKEKNNIKKTRKSNVCFLEHNQSYFIKRFIFPYVKLANKNAGWNIQYSVGENWQFTEYRGDVKGHYGWHRDSWNIPYPNDFFNIEWRNKIRKISIVISLTDGKEYEGGDFLASPDVSGPEQERKIINVEGLKKQGTIVVFPSFIFHKVCPVTFGKRNSLVCWMLGEKFR